MLFIIALDDAGIASILSRSARRDACSPLIRYFCIDGAPRCSVIATAASSRRWPDRAPQPKYANSTILPGTALLVVSCRPVHSCRQINSVTSISSASACMLRSSEQHRACQVSRSRRRNVGRRSSSVRDGSSKVDIMDGEILPGNIHNM